MQPDENLLFNNNPPNGLQILGITNQTNTNVAINGGETLVGNGGQARIEAADGLINSLFTYRGVANQSLGFDFADPALAFTQTEFRVFVGSGTATQLTLTFFDTTGHQFQNTFDIPSNGFFYANAIDGQQIDRFSFAANGSFEDVRQIRIGGVAAVNPPTAIVPEPTSWALMILGFGGVGALLRQRRNLRSVFA